MSEETLDTGAATALATHLVLQDVVLMLMKKGLLTREEMAPVLASTLETLRAGEPRVPFAENIIETFQRKVLDEP